MNAAREKQSASSKVAAQPTSADPAKDAGEGNVKQELRGMGGFDEQEARLAPAPPPRAMGNPDPANRLAGLHPTFADHVRRAIAIANGKGLDVFVAGGMRTHAEQNSLYAQGRTKPGQVVTWVRGGSSYHNYGLAVDLAFNGGKPYAESHNWKGLVASVREAGLISGASYGDRPHANLDVPMASLQTWYKAGGLKRCWDKVSETYGGPRFDGGDQEAAPEAGGTPKPGAGTYKVRPGDTLIDIAQAALGDGARWDEIATLNGIKDARELAVGKVLKLPTGAATKKDNADVGGESVFRQRSHVVAPGDSLTKIALKYYGMGSLWGAIAKANGITDPSKLAVGQKLTIPRQGEAHHHDDTPAPKTHYVASGDTLGEIAESYYNDHTRWRDIAKANNITNPSALRIGQKLTLP